MENGWKNELYKIEVVEYIATKTWLYINRFKNIKGAVKKQSENKDGVTVR